MSERLPYEEQLPRQLRDFPLPEEDAAWADMKRRLEEDDDDGIIVWWRKGCAGWGLLLLALIVTGWWFFARNSHNNEKKQATVSHQQKSQPNHAPGKNRPALEEVATGGIAKDPGMTARADTIGPVNDFCSSAGISSGRTPAGKARSGRKKKIITDLPARQKRDENKKDMKPDQPAQKSLVQPVPDITSAIIDRDHDDRTIHASDSTVINHAQLFIAGEPSTNRKIDSLKKNADKPLADTAKKDKKTASTSYSISGGLGLNQQLPIAGQKAVPYSSQGRRFSFADYIPSVYFRLNKESRWFVQGEFRYGAPQYNKPLTYFQQDDTTGGSSVITEKQLQKTYYHQLPVSFNYYITPRWVIGSGIVWNRFTKSVFQQSTRDLQAPADSFLSKEIVVGKDPESEGLSRSYLQGLVESQYQWKKLSFGARYAFGLSPYIHFTLPGQPEQKERSRSLQLFIKYELFKKKLNDKSTKAP